MRNYLGLTGACQIMRRDVFERVGGYDETFRISDSDIHLTLMAWRLGYRNVYEPAAVLVHHEGATRENTNRCR